MKNSTILFIMVIMILITGSFVFTNGKDGITTNVLANDNQLIQGQMQQIILSQNGYNYRDATAQAGKPIVLSADSSVRGCLRSAVFNIAGKRYSKYLRTPEDTLELPALPKGIYPFSCSMGMGFGKLIIQ